MSPNIFKKFLIGFPIVLSFFLSTNLFAGYQQQGFTSFTEGLDGSFNASCSNQCFVLLDKLGGLDYVKIEGNIEGNGQIGYGFLIGQSQIVPGEILNINGNQNINQNFVFYKSPYYAQIPKDAQVVVLVQGNVKIENGKLRIDLFGLGEKVAQGWKDFWTMETITPYSINLRYGVKILGTSIVQYGYIIFVIISLIILIFVKGNREKKINQILLLGLGIFMFIGIRNLISYGNIVKNGLQNYTFQTYENKSFFDLGDYIIFTDKVRKKLDLDNNKEWGNCKLYVESFQDRPFRAHQGAVYLKPCKFALTGSEANYFVYYKKQPNITGNLLLEFNGSYLLSK